MNSLEPSERNSQESQLARYVITIGKQRTQGVINEWMKQELWLLFEPHAKQCSFIVLAHIWGNVFALLLANFGIWLNLPGIYSSALL